MALAPARFHRRALRALVWVAAVLAVCGRASSDDSSAASGGRAPLSSTAGPATAALDTLTRHTHAPTSFVSRARRLDRLRRGIGGLGRLELARHHKWSSAGGMGGRNAAVHETAPGGEPGSRPASGTPSDWGQMGRAPDAPPSRASGRPGGPQKGGETQIGARPSVSTATTTTSPPARPHFAACVGVMSRPVTPRRAIVRSTWFSNATALEAKGVYARFVVGVPLKSESLPDPGAVEADLAAEAAAHGDIMRVPSGEAYESLLLKILAYYRTALAAVNASYYVKTDDDVFVRLDRVPAAAAQWSSDGAGYVGCLFLGGDMFADPASVYYEPLGALIAGRKYFGYMSGGFYAASRQAAAWLAARPDDTIRPLGCTDDCSIGLQMLGLPVRIVEDWRVCHYSCQPTSVVITDGCNGLCGPETAIPRLHADAACTGGGSGPDAIGPLWAPANQRFVRREDVDAIGCAVLKDGQIDRSACRKQQKGEGGGGR